MTADVVVIGGGLSGLASALQLSNSGAEVILCEQNNQLGGRTYSFVDKTTGDVVDNGQHVLVGAYHNTIKYLELIDARHFLNEQKNPRLHFHHPQLGFHTFELGNLLKPFNFAAAMLKFKLLPFNDRRKLINVGSELNRWDDALVSKLSQLTVDEWLSTLGQSEKSRKYFWYPIVLSVMNEMPERASALLFARSLKQTFLGKKSDASFLIPKVGQTELYLTNAIRILNNNGVKILTGSKVNSLLIDNNKIVGVEGSSKIKSKYVVSAVPHWSLVDILPQELVQHERFSVLRYFESSPIISVNLWYEKEVSVHTFGRIEFAGLIERNLQWVFNRRRLMGEEGKPSNYISAVISAAYDYINLSKDKIIEIALNELKDIFPRSEQTKLKHALVIKEKRATFSATNRVEPLRPGPETLIENFYLAGDWTNTGLPATIEGAISSGFKCAELIKRDF